MSDIDIAQIIAALFYVSLVIFYLFVDPRVSVALVLTFAIVAWAGWWDQSYQEKKEKAAAARRQTEDGAEAEEERGETVAEQYERIIADN